MCGKKVNVTCHFLYASFVARSVSVCALVSLSFPSRALATTMTTDQHLTILSPLLLLLLLVPLLSFSSSDSRLSRSFTRDETLDT